MHTSQFCRRSSGNISKFLGKYLATGVELFRGSPLGANFRIADNSSRARLLPLAVTQFPIADLSVHLNPIRVPFQLESLRSESLVSCNRKTS